MAEVVRKALSGAGPEADNEAVKGWIARHYPGREFNHALLADLPAGVDPCGENGEFHTFAYAGPMFREPIAIAVGETCERDGFVFTDLQWRSTPSALSV